MANMPASLQGYIRAIRSAALGEDVREDIALALESIYGSAYDLNAQSAIYAGRAETAAIDARESKEAFEDAIDDTLSLSGHAADAKAVGDIVNEHASSIETLDDRVSNVEELSEQAINVFSEKTVSGANITIDDGANDVRVKSFITDIPYDPNGYTGMYIAVRAENDYDPETNTVGQFYNDELVLTTNPAVIMTDYIPVFDEDTIYYRLSSLNVPTNQYVNVRFNWFDSEKNIVDQWQERFVRDSSLTGSVSIPSGTAFIRISTNPSIAPIGALSTVSPPSETFQYGGSRIYFIDWSEDVGVIFGGSLNATNGILTSRYHSDGSLITVPVTREITPVQVITFLGYNDIHTNIDGIIDLIYRTDLTMYIDAKTDEEREDIDSLEARMTTAEGDIDSLEPTVENHSSRITDLETAVGQKQDAISLSNIGILGFIPNTGVVGIDPENDIYFHIPNKFSQLFQGYLVLNRQVQYISSGNVIRRIYLNGNKFKQTDGIGQNYRGVNVLSRDNDCVMFSGASSDLISALASHRNFWLPKNILVTPVGFITFKVIFSLLSTGGGTRCLSLRLYSAIVDAETDEVSNVTLLNNCTNIGYKSKSFTITQEQYDSMTHFALIGFSQSGSENNNCTCYIDVDF